MKRTSNGWWEQETAGESVAAEHANASEFERRRKLAASINDRGWAGGCMSCNDLHAGPVVVFYLGSFQGRLCKACARSLAAELRAKT